MKNAISLYFQPYYFKGGSGDIFKGVNKIDLKASYINLVNRQRQSIGKDTDFTFSNSYITCAKYVLAKLRTVSTNMDIDDVYILNNLMANTLTSGIKQLVTDCPDIANTNLNGLRIWIGNNTGSTVGEVRNNLKDKGYIKDTLFWRDRVLPLGVTLCSNFTTYDTETLNRDCGMSDDYNVSHAYITDQKVNDFISVLGKDDKPNTFEPDPMNYTIADALEVRWVSVVNMNSTNYGPFSYRDNDIEEDGLIGVVTCKSLFGRMLAMSKARKSNEDLRNQVLDFLYQDLLKNNKEELVCGTDLEAMYLVSKRLR